MLGQSFKTYISYQGIEDICGNDEGCNDCGECDCGNCDGDCGNCDCGGCDC